MLGPLKVALRATGIGRPATTTNARQTVHENGSGPHVAVGLAGADAFQVHIPHVGVAGERFLVDGLGRLGILEEQQIDSRGVLAVQPEVRALVDECRAEVVEVADVLPSQGRGLVQRMVESDVVGVGSGEEDEQHDWPLARA